MLRDEAVNRFCAIFPMWANHIVKWTPNKDGSVKIELTGKQFFIFTYADDHTWRLETVRMHKNVA